MDSYKNFPGDSRKVENYWDGYCYPHFIDDRLSNCLRCKVT